MASTDSAQSQSLKEDQQIDQLIAQAVQAASRGENVDQLQEAIFSMLPAQGKEKIRTKFAAALKAKKLPQPAVNSTEVVSRTAITRIRDMFTQSARQAFERISNLMRSRPDLAASIQQAGKVLMKNGVIIDKVTVSEADLGTMAPLAGVGTRTQTTERGA